MSSAAELKQELKVAGTPKRAIASQRYFKTGVGEYGEGDVFMGVSAPDQRKIAKKYYGLPLTEVEKLLTSKIHEQRLTAMFILVEQFKKGDAKTQKEIYTFYLGNTRYINNWDIIDGSAPYIVGPYLRDKDRSILVKLAKSNSIWERRIAMMSTFYFIRQGGVVEAFGIAKILLHDEHDLIQKAVGWMLREIGNSAGIEIEEQFLKEHYKTMPRTMLRYAIEKFPEPKRKAYLNGRA